MVTSIKPKCPGESLFAAFHVFSDVLHIVSYSLNFLTHAFKNFIMEIKSFIYLQFFPF